MSEPKKNYLTESEVEQFLKASKKTRNGKRDYCMALMCYRHGLRVSELIDIRLDELDLEGSSVYIRREKGSLSTRQPIEGDEMRAIRAWLRERSATSRGEDARLFFSIRGPFTRQAVNAIFATISKKAGFGFKVYPHMLRHSCGFALANKQIPTRTIQDYLGHKSIQHTVRYTATNAGRFKNLWRK